MVMRIGVNATTSVQAGRSNPGTPSGRFQIAGVTATGPVDGSTVVRSLAQYVQTYGGRTSYAAHMYDAAQLFFEEGGGELVVTRVVGPDASGAAVTLLDRAAEPVATLDVESRQPGQSALSVRVADEPGGTYSLEVLNDGARVHFWQGLTSPTDAVAAAAGSRWVDVSSVGSVTAAPNNNPAPGTFTLSGGSDDRAAITTEHIGTALTNGGLDATGGALAAPGYPADVIAETLVPVAVAHRQIVLLSAAANATRSEVASVADGLVGMEHGDYAGLFYPWVVVPDGTRRRVVDPVAYVAAVRARAHVGTGYWRVPAGEQSRVEWAVDTQPVVDVAANDDLAGSRVNGIATIYGTPRLYGWQSLSGDVENLGLLSARDTLNSITIAVERVLEPYVFATIDGRGYLQSRVEGDVSGVLSPVADAGGLYARINEAGELLDPGYRVTVDSSINTVETLARNELHVRAAVRLSPTAQLINAEVVKVALGSAL